MKKCLLVIKSSLFKVAHTTSANQHNNYMYMKKTTNGMATSFLDVIKLHAKPLNVKGSFNFLPKAIAFVLLSISLLMTNSVKAQVINETFEEAAWTSSSAATGTTSGGTVVMPTNTVSSTVTNYVFVSTTAGTGTATSVNTINNAGSWWYSQGSLSSDAKLGKVSSASHSWKTSGTSSYIITPVITTGIATVTIWGAGAPSTTPLLILGVNTNTTATVLSAAAASSVNFRYTSASFLPSSAFTYTYTSGTASTSGTSSTSYARSSSWTINVTQPCQLGIFPQVGAYIDDIVITSPACTTAGTPSPSAVTACMGGSAVTMSGATTGSSPTYQWQFSTISGGTYTNVADGTPTGVTYGGSGTSATLSITAGNTATAGSGYYYKCIASVACNASSGTSAATQLTIAQPIVIGTGPSATSVTQSGSAATMSVSSVTGTSPTYQWQHATSAGGTYTNVVDGTPTGVTYGGSGTSATLSITASGSSTVGVNDYYQCVVSGASPCGSVTSGNAALTIAAAGLSTPPTLAAAANQTVDNDFVITYTNDNTWNAAVTGITVDGGSTLSGSTYYTTPAAGSVSVHTSAITALHTPGSHTIIIKATGYNDASVVKTTIAGTATQLAIKTALVAPASNGVVFATEPAVYIEDQYGNVTTSTATVTPTVTGGQTWLIGGSEASGKAAVAGTATFTNLTAGSTGGVLYSGATITFTSGSLSTVASASFVIPAYATSSTDYFRSNASADWATASTWQSSPDNSTWYTASAAPTAAAKGIDIRVGNVVGVSSGVTIGTITTNNVAATIEGELDINTGGSLTIASGSSLSVTGTINNTVTTAITTTGTLAFGASSNYILSANGGVIPAATWNASSTIKINGITSAANLATVNAPTSGNYGNLVVDIPSATGFKLWKNWASSITFGGSVTLERATSTGVQMISSTNGTAVTINGDLNVYAGEWAWNNFTTATITVLGNLNIDATQNVGSTNFTSPQLDLATNRVGGSGTPSTTLNVGGNIVITSGTNPGTGSAATATLYQDKGTATVVFQGSSNQTFTNNGTITGTIGYTVSNTGTSPNNLVTISNDLTVGGTLTLTSGQFVVGAHTLSLNGASITGAGANTNLITTSSSSLSFGGTSTGVVIPSNVSSLNNLTIANTSGVTSSSSISVGGTMSVTGLFIPAAANVISGAGSLTGTGTIDVTRATGSGDFAAQYTIPKTLTNLTVEFDGTSAQGVGANTFGGLKINNANGVTLGGSVSVAGALTLTSGTLTTTSSNILTLATTATVSGGSSSSYVSGPMQNTISGTASTPVTFPIGKSGEYSPVTLTVAQTAATSTTYKAEVFAGGTTPTHTIPGTLSVVSQTRYYTLSSSASNISTASITLVYDANDAGGTGGVDVTTAANIRIAGLSGWNNLGGTGSASGSGTITSATNFNTLGDFVIANAFALSNPPALTAAVGATVDANLNVTFTDNSAWRSAVTTVKYGSNVLSAGTDYTLSAGTLTLKPGGSSGSGLRIAGTQTVTVSATGYNDATISQTIGVGVAAKLAMKTQPTAPATTGSVFATQPAVYIQDQYGNSTTSTATVTAAVGAGSWTIGGTLTTTAVSGTATFTNLTGAAAAAVSGSTISFTSGSLTGITSSTFTVPGPTVYYWVGGTTAGTTFGAVGTLATSVGGTGNATAYTGMNTAGNTDVIIFDGTNLGGGATGTVNFNWPSSSTTYYGQIKLQNGATVIANATGSRTITINGGVGTDFSVPSGCSLSTTGSTTTLSLLTGTTGSISGTLTLGTGSSTTTIVAADAGAVTFNNGSTCTFNNSSSSTAPFGTGTAGSVIFASGSTLTNTKAGDIFGGNKVVTLQTGSTYIYNCSASSTALAIDGNTFGNLTIGASASPVVGSAGFTINGDLNVNTGTFTIIETGSANSISGNINIASGATLKFNPASAATLSLNGSSAKTFTNAGTLTTVALQAIEINNTSGITLGSNFSTLGTLSLVAGNLSVGSNSLSIGGLTTSGGGMTASSTASITYTGTSAITLPSAITALASLVNNSTGTITIGNGTLALTGAFTNNGTINGTINLNGSSAQTITGTGTLGALSLNNSAGASITSGSQSITSLLSVVSGTLNTGTKGIILKSTSIANTAIVDAVTGAITGTVQVERYIPKGFRAYRDIAPEVYNASGSSTKTMYYNWQENGSLLNNGYGIFITGPTSTDATLTDYASGQKTANSSTGLDYSINGISSAYTYGGGTWPAITSTKGTNLDCFQGYRILVRGDRSFNLATTPIVNTQSGLAMLNATTLRATGQLVYGTVTYSTTGVSGTSNGTTVTSTSTLSATPGGFSLVANPYVAPVLWGTGSGSQSATTTVYGASNAAAAGGINGSYWFLDPTLGATGFYRAYNALTGSSVYTNLATSLPSSGAAGYQYIQPGQAVFVQSASATPQVVFLETAKATNSTKIAVFGATQLSKIYVSLMKQSATTKTFDKVDGAAVAFRGDFGNKTYGPQDALKFSNATDNLAISDKGKNLSIDGRLPATASDAIPLAITKPTATAYQLSIDATNYINEGFEPMLYDAFKNTTKALGTGNTTISFTVDASNAASFSNRFTILFAPSALPVNSIVASASLSNKVATINWNTVGEKNVAAYEVEKSTDAKNFTAIEKVTAKNTATASYTSTDNSVTATTYYRIKAVSTTGAISYSNVAKLTTDNRLPSYSLYPNPLKGKTLNVELANVVAGKYTVSIYNALGQRVSGQTISHTGGSATHAINIDNSLAAGVYSVTISEANSKQVVHQSNLSVQP